MFWYVFILLYCPFGTELIGLPVAHICVIHEPTKFGRLFPTQSVYAQIDCAVPDCLNSL